MRKISIIATDYHSEDIREVIGKLNSMFYRQYHYELILFEEKENLESLKSISNLKILRATKKLTLNQKITAAFEVTDGACTILADFKVLDCYKYIQNLLQLWQNGANVVLSRYKDLDKKLSNKISTGAYNFIAGVFGMYDTNNCNNTFQLFSKCVADVIKKSPAQNAYLRNTKAWQDYKVMIVATNNFVEVKENKQKFTSTDKFWSAVSVIGLAMLSLFIAMGFDLFKGLPQANVIGTSYMFVSLCALIVGVPSLIVSRVKNKFSKCYKKEAYQPLFDASLRRLFDLDLYDEKEAGLKSINFDATRVRDNKNSAEKTYHHGFEKYVPQFLTDGSIAPKRKMEYVGAQKGPVLYSYLSTAQAVANNQVSINIKAPKTEKIKTSTKAKELNETIKKLTTKEDNGKVVLKQKTVKNESVKKAPIISSSTSTKPQKDVKTSTKKAVQTKKETASKTAISKAKKEQTSKKTATKKTSPKTMEVKKVAVKKPTKTTTAKTATKTSVKTKEVSKSAPKTKSETTLKSNYKSKETVSDLKKQLEDKLQAAIESVRAENKVKKK